MTGKCRQIEDNFKFDWKRMKNEMEFCNTFLIFLFEDEFGERWNRIV